MMPGDDERRDETHSVGSVTLASAMNSSLSSLHLLASASSADSHVGGTGNIQGSSARQQRI